MAAQERICIKGTRFLVTGETLHIRRKEIEAAGLLLFRCMDFRGGGYSRGCEKTTAG